MSVADVGNRHLSSRRPIFIPAWIAMAGLALTMILPLVFVLLTALRTVDDYNSNPSGLPTRITFENIITALVKAGFGKYILNTLLVVCAVVLLVVVLSTMAGFAFAFLELPFKNGILLSVVFLMVLPATLFLVPTFQVIIDMHLLGNYLGVIFVDAAMTLPFGVFLMAKFFQSVPGQLLEAARMDGASVFQTFRLIALPLVRPAVKTLTILTALGVWNELLFALLIMQNPDRRLLTAGLALLNSNPALGGSVQIPVIAAALLMAALPPFLLFVIFNRSLVEGLTAGALR
jgi:ABC-type glycerol-3-phosphate transport system permease component